MIKKVLLAAGCLLLLVGCGLLVVFLRGGDEEPETDETVEPLPLPVAVPAPAPVEEEPAPRVVKPRATRRAPRPAPARLVTLPPSIAAPPAAAPPVLNVTRQPIAQVQATKMHKLTPPRMDAKRLDEQTRKLGDALAEAKRKGTWSRERIRQVQAQLKALHLNQLQHRLQKGREARDRPTPFRGLEQKPAPPAKHEDERPRDEREPEQEREPRPKHEPEPKHHPDPEDEGETDRPD